MYSLGVKNLMVLELRKFRRSIKNLSVELQKFDRRIRSDEIFQLCHRVEPSDIGFLFLIISVCLIVFKFHHFPLLFVLVPTGGKVFEMYLDFASSWKAHDLWKGFLKNVDVLGNMITLTEAEMDNLVDIERNKFHGFCLLMTSFVSNNRNQLFYHTLALKFHGLSRMGNHMLAQIGFSMKPSSFDTHQHAMLETAKNQIRHVFFFNTFY
jgi:hypothetical protein